jgi:hypothetical protein
MLVPITRAIQAVTAVGAGLVAAGLLGDGSAAKLIGVLISALLMIIIEWILLVAPKKLVWARRKLDSRSRFEGAWIQDVVCPEKQDQVHSPNRFAIFVVSYSDSSDEYVVEGTAYDRHGKSHSTWTSDPVQFPRDRKSMTYLWRGVVVADIGSDPRGVERSGFTKLSMGISNRAGTGRVDHAAMAVTMQVRFFGPPAEVARAAQVDISSLVDPVARDRFALAYSHTLASSNSDQLTESRSAEPA